MNTTTEASALRETVAAVMDEVLPQIMAGFEMVLAEQKRTNAAIAALELSEAVIGEKVEQYNAKMAVIKGGV